MDTPPKKVWTYDELLQLPEDGKRYEIIEGELVEMSSPLVIHQRVVGNLFAAFREQVQSKQLGEVFIAPLDVVMTPTRVVQPDLIVVRTENRSIVQDRIRGVPDLLVEVLSPTNYKHDTVTKRRLYARSRLHEYWIVDTEAQTIEVLELVEGGLSYRQHGWYGPGDRARSASFPVELAVDPLFL
jgi:Uma2 family endonuclease